MLGSRRLVYQVCRWTSLGPPPSPPPTVGSFSHKYDTFLAKYPMMHALHNRVVNGQFKIKLKFEFEFNLE